MNYDFNETMDFGTFLSSLLSFNDENHFAAIRNSLNAKGKKVTFFNYGRNALQKLIGRVSRKGDSLVFQAFICPWLVEEATKMGRVPVLVDACPDTFNIDVKHLAEKQAEAKMTFVAHNFGVPADIFEVRKVCQSHLVEDMAHSMFASLNGVALGSFGDSVLYSMYKQLPNLHGSVLASNLDIDQPAVRESTSLADIKKLMIRIEGLHQIFVDIVRKRGDPHYTSETYEMRSPSRTAVSLFAKLLTEAKARIGRKEKVAEIYYSRVRKTDKFHAQKISPYASPSWFSFNIRLDEEIAESRDSIISDLRRSGIYCDRQWFDAPVGKYTIPGSIVQNCENAVLLSKTIINLPLKDYYSSDNVDYVLDSLREAIERTCRN